LTPKLRLIGPLINGRYLPRGSPIGRDRIRLELIINSIRTSLDYPELKPSSTMTAPRPSRRIAAFERLAQQLEAMLKGDAARALPDGQLMEWLLATTSVCGDAMIG
jgi:hypothetical protein